MASFFGYKAAPEPAYTVLRKMQEYEIRHYDKELRASVLMPGQMEKEKGNAFRALAGYIFGGNTKQTGQEQQAEKIPMTAPVVMNTTTKGSEKIEMTAPVAIQSQQDKQVTLMSFILPDKYKSVSELPAPKDSRVQLSELPARDMAVIGFSWGFTEKRMRDNEQKLRMAAARDQIKLSTNPQEVELWAYNPPWTLPWCKRNEVAIPVVKD